MPFRWRPYLAHLVAACAYVNAQFGLVPGHHIAVTNLLREDNRIPVAHRLLITTRLVRGALFMLRGQHPGDFNVDPPPQFFPPQGAGPVNWPVLDARVIELHAECTSLFAFPYIQNTEFESKHFYVDVGLSELSTAISDNCDTTPVVDIEVFSDELPLEPPGKSLSIVQLV